MLTDAFGRLLDIDAPETIQCGACHARAERLSSAFKGEGITHHNYRCRAEGCPAGGTIVEHERGVDHREMDHRWARAIRDQCERDDVAFFFKQSAGRQPEQGQALVEANLTRTVHRELPDLPAITQAARGERPPAAAETEEVSP